MNFIKIAFAVLLIGSFTSCGHTAGEYSSIHARRFDRVDVPLQRAWNTAVKALGERYEIIANDTVNKTLKVKTFYHVATVQFESLTPATCQYTVSSRSLYAYPNKAAIQTVYMELDRALKTQLD